MTPLRTIGLLQVLFILFTTLIGGMVGDQMLDSLWRGWAIGGVAGLVVVLGDQLLKGISLRVFSSATFGLFLGFLFTWLLLSSGILFYLTNDMRWLISLSIYVVCGYVGMMLAMRSNRDEFALIIPYVRFQQSGVFDTPVLVDTNVLIEGKLEDIRDSGFISGSLIVPRFVLDELQLLADSSDSQRRDRGRKGLENLSRLKFSPKMNVSIHETPPDPGIPVDTRLVNLAKVLGSKLLTNDVSLAKIARLQQVPVMNINDLARALNSSVAPGDAVEILLTKEGREPHQAVGFMSDGSMVVVNHASGHIGKTVLITVSSSVPTAAGRIFFAELKQA
ncbi:MAG: hypothetical protein QM796_13655 [Chthoniobacteraceae bacterium]